MIATTQQNMTTELVCVIFKFVLSLLQSKSLCACLSPVFKGRICDVQWGIPHSGSQYDDYRLMFQPFFAHSDFLSIFIYVLGKLDSVHCGAGWCGNSTSTLIFFLSHADFYSIA